MFSIAITAWSAKVLRSAICLSVKGRTSGRRTKISPIGYPLGATAWQGRSSAARLPDSRLEPLGTRGRFCDMSWTWTFAVDHGSAGEIARLIGSRVPWQGTGTMFCHHAEGFTIETIDQNIDASQRRAALSATRPVRVADPSASWR